MEFGESLLVGLFMMSVVFSVLIALWLSIRVVSFIFSKIEKKS